MKLIALLLLLLIAFPLIAQSKSDSSPSAAELDKMAARFAPTEIKVDLSKLSAGDRQALVKLVEAARVVDEIFLVQYWSGNHALYKKLQEDKSPLGQARLHYFWINKSPWSTLDGFKAFIPGVPARKPLGANFYPEDMSKEEFEAWLKAPHPSTGPSGAWCYAVSPSVGFFRALICQDTLNKDQATGFFTVIHRVRRYTSSEQSATAIPGEKDTLAAFPYSEQYQSLLERAGKLLREAADLTDNATLKKFLTTRAAALTSNDYYDSDVAWMELDAPIDLTYGPYETYNDELFGYKASFEAYVNLRDDVETEKVQSFAARMQEIENNLPIEQKYKNPKLGPSAPIRVVNEVFSAGDGNHAIQTAAYNLPNDEKVTAEKGTKRVMLKNVQEAKFKQILIPIAQRVLTPEAQPDVDFETFFTHILAHEMTHGIGPHQIDKAIIGGDTRPGQRSVGSIGSFEVRHTTVRHELKDVYSAIEEAKADVTGLFMLQHLMDKEMKGARRPGGAVSGDERKLYTTYLASAFRSLRFGTQDAHGKGMAVQFNYISDQGGFVVRPDGRYEVNFRKIKSAVEKLDHDLLTLEATGDYDGTRKLLDDLGHIRPETQKVLDRLKDLPTDIEPVFVTANRMSAPPPGAPTTAELMKKTQHKGTQR